MVLLGICIGLILGFIIGAVVVISLDYNKLFGTIKMADSDDGPYLFLDLDKQPKEMSKYKFVWFRVDVKKISSQD